MSAEATLRRFFLFFPGETSLTPPSRLQQIPHEDPRLDLRQRPSRSERGDGTVSSGEGAEEGGQGGSCSRRSRTDRVAINCRFSSSSGEEGQEDGDRRACTFVRPPLSLSVCETELTGKISSSLSPFPLTSSSRPRMAPPPPALPTPPPPPKRSPITCHGALSSLLLCAPLELISSRVLFARSLASPTPSVDDLRPPPPLHQSSIRLPASPHPR